MSGFVVVSVVQGGVWFCRFVASGRTSPNRAQSQDDATRNNPGVNMPRMCVLVTGGAGFVGSHFVKAATAEGLSLVVLDDLSGQSPGAKPAVAPSVPFYRGDIGDLALVRNLCEKHAVSALVHFAGKIQVGESVRKPALYFDVNLARSLNLLEAVRQAGVSQVVFSSTAAVYGNPVRVPIPETAETAPVNPYGFSKLSLEWVLHSYAAAYGLRYAALRYFNAAGAHPDGTLAERHDPETHLVPLLIDAARGRRPALQVFGTDYGTPDGTCVRDYIHVCDLAQAHLLALFELGRGHNVGPLNLGTGQGYSVRQMLEATQRVLKIAVPHEFGPRRQGDPASLVACAKAAEKQLGFVPKHSDIHTLIEDADRARQAL